MLPSFDDLAAAWGAMVRANSEQVERFQESAPRSDFYAPMAASFKADPRRTDDPTLDHLRRLVRPGDTWLDIGGGAGRIALPLALLARSVTVLEPSPAMLAILRESMDEYGIANVVPIEARWPAPGSFTADCALISHVGYDVEAIGPFVEAMEAAAARCVAVLLDRAPASAASAFWPDVHGEARNELPAAREFIALLLARGRLPAVSLYERPAMTYRDRDHALGFLRNQLWVAEGSDKDARLRAALGRIAIETETGIQVVPAPSAVAVIEWTPRG
jgi:hypothetical protein